jgi:hypothetical protein
MNENWISTWGQAPTDLSVMNIRAEGQTLRAAVPVTLSGRRLRLKLSNEYGKKPIAITRCRVRGAGGEVVPVTAEGSGEIVLVGGERLITDPVRCPVQGGTDLQIDLFFQNAVKLRTGNMYCGETLVLQGDVSEESGAPGIGQSYRPQPLLWVDSYRQPMPFVPLLTDVQVDAPPDAVGIVIFGDSISIGDWPLHVARRLREAYGDRFGVIRRAIMGNRLLWDSRKSAFGPADVRRFERDVLAMENVHVLFLKEGMNDLIFPGLLAPESEAVTPGDIFEGLAACAQKARDAGIHVVGAAMIPLGGSVGHTDEIGRGR